MGLRTVAQEFLLGTDPETVLNTLREIIYKRLAKLVNAVGSGWVLERIEYIRMKFAEYRVTIGSSYKPLPEDVKHRRAILDIENNDNECFKWSVIRALHPVKGDGERVTKILRRQVEKYDWVGVRFPTPFPSIDLFENINKVSVMVLGWNEELKHVEHLRLPRTKHKKVVQLFLHDGHYSLIVSMSKLTNANMNKHTYRFCPYCPYKHRTEETLMAHIESCAVNELTQVKLPKEGECVYFEKWECTLRRPYAIYADFRCRLLKEDVKKGEHTVQTHSHIWVRCQTLTLLRASQSNIHQRPTTRTCHYTSLRVFMT